MRLSAGCANLPGPARQHTDAKKTTGLYVEVWGLGFGFKVKGLTCRVYNVFEEFGVWGLGFGEWGLAYTFRAVKHTIFADFKILIGRVSMRNRAGSLATQCSWQNFSPRPAPSHHFPTPNEGFELYWEEMHKNMPKHARMHSWHPSPAAT